MYHSSKFLKLFFDMAWIVDSFFVNFSSSIVCNISRALDWKAKLQRYTEWNLSELEQWKRKSNSASSFVSEQIDYRTEVARYKRWLWCMHIQVLHVDTIWHKQGGINVTRDRSVTRWWNNQLKLTLSAVSYQCHPFYRLIFPPKYYRIISIIFVSFHVTANIKIFEFLFLRTLYSMRCNFIFRPTFLLCFNYIHRDQNYIA